FRSQPSHFHAARHQPSLDAAHRWCRPNPSAAASQGVSRLRRRPSRPESRLNLHILGESSTDCLTIPSTHVSFHDHRWPTNALAKVAQPLPKTDFSRAAHVLGGIHLHSWGSPVPPPPVTVQPSLSACR
ncbi:Os02g0807300, partial [Oryza sativa Japonica Group]